MGAPWHSLATIGPRSRTEVSVTTTEYIQLQPSKTPSRSTFSDEFHVKL